MAVNEYTITGLFTSRFLLLPAKIKSIDFERFIYLYAAVAFRMKKSHVLFETQVSEKK